MELARKVFESHCGSTQRLLTYFSNSVVRSQVALTIEHTHLIAKCIANLQKMAVAERRDAEPTTGRRNEVGLAVRQATIELLAESCRQ